MGDIVYMLPTLKCLDVKTLYLFPSGNTNHRMTPARANWFAPLIRSQGIDCFASANPIGRNLDTWRIGYQGGNLAHHMATHFQVSPNFDKWLDVTPHRVARYVFARSSRYQNQEFNWDRAIRGLRDNAVFVGTVEEHKTFIAQFGSIAYCPMPDCHMLSRVIAGCDLFVGNQSLPLAIAQGLGQNFIAEVPPKPACHFKRSNGRYEL